MDSDAPGNFIIEVMAVTVVSASSDSRSLGARTKLPATTADCRYLVGNEDAILHSNPLDPADAVTSLLPRYTSGAASARYVLPAHARRSAHANSTSHLGAHIRTVRVVSICRHVHTCVAISRALGST